jgi:TPR repeat protein
MGLSWAGVRRALAATTLAAVFASPALAEDFSSGLREYLHGDHAVAARLWAPLAERGDARSQSALGYLYLNGFGVPKNIGEAVYWYKKAAAQGEPEAEAYLGSFYIAGNGLARNLVEGLKWCELAVWHGATRGMGCRSLALQQMEVAQMREGWSLFSRWVEEHPFAAWRGPPAE